LTQSSIFRLKNEIEIVGDQVEKHKAAKDALRTLNETYKKQIVLVKEESKLRLEVCSLQSFGCLFRLLLFRKNSQSVKSQWEATVTP